MIVASHAFGPPGAECPGYRVVRRLKPSVPDFRDLPAVSESVPDLILSDQSRSLSGRFLIAKAVRKNNFSNSFGNDQECLFFQGSVCYRPGTIAEVIFAHCLNGLRM